MATRIPISAGGLDGEFTALVGTVIATERNSDSRVRGGGSTTSVNGQVFGTTNITTDVMVSRDIWLRDVEGVEHHKRLNLDLPVRVGQRFAFVGYKGASRLSKRPVAYELRILNLSTDRYYERFAMKHLVTALSRPAHEDFTLPIALGWALSLFFCLLKGIGLLGVAPLAWRHKKVRAARLEENRAIGEVVERKFRDVLALVDAEGAQLAPAPETPTGSRLQSGTAA